MLEAKRSKQMRPSSVAMRNRSSFSRCSFSAFCKAQAVTLRIIWHNGCSGFLTAAVQREQPRVSDLWRIIKADCQRLGLKPPAYATEVLAKTEWKPADFQERQQRFLSQLKQEWILD